MKEDPHQILKSLLMIKKIHTIHSPIEDFHEFNEDENNKTVGLTERRMMFVHILFL